MKKLQVNDIVRNTWYKGLLLRGVLPHGQMARVVEVGGEEVRVHWDDPKFQEAFQGANRHDGQWWSMIWWECVGPGFTLDQPYALRNGQPVEVQRTGQADRPYRATKVTVNGYELSPTYDASGQFYPMCQGPLDLVNV